jgi:hypothetical protein
MDTFQKNPKIRQAALNVKIQMRILE